jgi:sugar phosphate isomerase/epimerase
MKLGISLYSYGGDLQARRMTTDEAIEHAAKIGSEGIEIVAEQNLQGWPNPKYADMIAMKERIRSLGMEMVCFSCYLPSMLRSGRKQTLAEIKELATQEIIEASVMGARICRPIYFNMSGVIDGKPGESDHERQELVEIISECLPVLKKYKMIWGVELHAPYPYSYYAQVIKMVNSPYVKLLPDFSCWQGHGSSSEYDNSSISAFVGANPISTFVELIPAVCHCHAKAHAFDKNGEEPNTPYKGLLGALKDANYPGYVVAEYEGWYFGDQDSRRVVKTHFDLLKRYGR